MLVLVDQSFSEAVGLFEVFGEVRTFAGRSVRRSDVVDADALIVRSVTRIDASLLGDTAVRFVGSATSGTDHVDKQWLDSRGISFASAAGCNARPVAEYIVAAMLELAERGRFCPDSATLGVVGVGRIGSRVADWGRAMGLRVMLCDPPLQRRTAGGGFVPFDELARHADVVSLHVSLTHSGEDITAGMVDEQWLSALKTGAILINTSRGAVVREAELLAALDAGHLGGTVLDVWRNEPDVNRSLVKRADVATPHVAGYSVQARQRILRRMHDALADFIARKQGPAAGVEPEADAPPPALRTGSGADRSQSPGTALCGGSSATGKVENADPHWVCDAAGTVRRCCDVAALHRAFSAVVERDEVARGFDDLRKSWVSRKEFGAHRLAAPSLHPRAYAFLSRLGFEIVP